MASKSISSSLSLIRKPKCHSNFETMQTYECEGSMYFFNLCTSACPDPSCWWSGSSVQWWRPARPYAAAPDLDPFDSSHSLQMMVCNIWQNKSLICVTLTTFRTGAQWGFWFICYPLVHKYVSGQKAKLRTILLLKKIKNKFSVFFVERIKISFPWKCYIQCLSVLKSWWSIYAHY